MQRRPSGRTWFTLEGLPSAFNVARRLSTCRERDDALRLAHGGEVLQARAPQIKGQPSGCRRGAPAGDSCKEPADTASDKLYYVN